MNIRPSLMEDGNVDQDIKSTLKELREGLKILTVLGENIVRTYKVHPRASKEA
ncbi:hypothetical protein [Pareuzebyella sediminis]|uniref:hypothetical protein n=1 Tax=Pareuzebyella sediminis TaxID=2607998 RepID=UPI0018E18F35|nr:hypothetical protein [Pareuzebyella sediminis]